MYILLYGVLGNIASYCTGIAWAEGEGNTPTQVQWLVDKPRNKVFIT